MLCKAVCASSCVRHTVTSIHCESPDISSKLLHSGSIKTTCLYPNVYVVVVCVCACVYIHAWWWTMTHTLNLGSDSTTTADLSKLSFAPGQPVSSFIYPVNCLLQCQGTAAMNLHTTCHYHYPALSEKITVKLVSLTDPALHTSVTIPSIMWSNHPLGDLWRILMLSPFNLTWLNNMGQERAQAPESERYGTNMYHNSSTKLIWGNKKHDIDTWFINMPCITCAWKKIHGCLSHLAHISLLARVLQFWVKVQKTEL